MYLMLMAKYFCHCEKCGINFVSHKSQRKLCNMCSTGGLETKEAICKKCGKTFLLYRNSNDENNFYKRSFCLECSGCHCEECGKSISKEDYYVNNRKCKECKDKVINYKNYNDITHYCTKCKTEIEVENVPGTNRYLPKGKKRKLCDKCYEEFLQETKEIICKKCGNTFIVGRSKTDGEFLLRDYCDDCYNTYVKKPEYKLKICKKCGKEFKIYPNKDGNFTEHKQYCQECLPLALKEGHNKTCLEKYGVAYSCLLPQCQSNRLVKTSKLNNKFAEFLNNKGIRTELEWYDKEHNRHYDIHLPDKNILIEINPTYTHNIFGSHFDGFEYKDENKVKWLHFYRTEDIKEYKHVIHVWDWDNWYKILYIVQDKLKLYARKLIVKEITNKDEIKNFLEINHIQGNCRNKKVCLGLYDNEELIQVMVFGRPRYNKNYQWELFRLCTKFDSYVVGGAEKLFKYFINNYQPESIISYCDISKFTGNVYDRLGFKLLKQTSPAKIWSKGKEHITDNLLRQRGFDQLFKTNYGKGTSNEELMLQHSWLPIYDCGQKVFEWKKV